MVLKPLCLIFSFSHLIGESHALPLAIPYCVSFFLFHPHQDVVIHEHLVIVQFTQKRVGQTFLQ